MATSEGQGLARRLELVARDGPSPRGKLVFQGRWRGRAPKGISGASGMKRGTEAKVKFKKLARALGFETWQVRGLLESIWHFAATNSPAGDIGRYSDEEIAIGIDFGGEIGPVLKAMVETEWLDAHPVHRLIIHHWPEHCEDTIHAFLGRRRILFADGSIPKLGKLPKAERHAAERTLKKLAEDYQYHNSARGGIIPPDSADGGKMGPTYTCALPIPAPKPLPKPAALQRQVAGVFDGLSEADLSDSHKLASWFDDVTARKKPVVQNTEANRVRVFAAAERALEAGDTPVGLFAWIVAGAKWDHITQAQEDRARQRLKSLKRQRDGPASGDIPPTVNLKPAPFKPRDDY